MKHFLHTSAPSSAAEERMRSVIDHVIDGIITINERGIAIAMGELVDAAIVVVEQTHKKLEQAQRDGSTRDYHKVVLEAVKEVAPASFFALLVIAVSFLPVLALESQEGRLFKPLAWTKTLAMASAALLSITLVPVAMGYFWWRRRIWMAG